MPIRLTKKGWRIDNTDSYYETRLEAEMVLAVLKKDIRGRRVLRALKQRNKEDK